MTVPSIDFWFSIGSTYSYLTIMRLKDVERQIGIAFEWRPFSVRRIMIEQNNVPFAEKPVKSAYMWRDIERRAAAYDVPVRVPAPYPLREFDLVVGRITGEPVVPQRLLGDGDAVGIGDRSELVDSAELDVVARIREHLRDRPLVEGRRVGEPGATIADHADADALALGRHEVLDVTLVDAHLGLAAAHRERLDLLTRMRLCDDPIGDRLEFGL